MQTQMSESTTDSVQQVLLHNYCTLLGISILCYEYLMTLDDEVEFFWGRKFNSVTCLYFVNRYVSMFANVFVIVHNFGTLSPNGCSKLYIINQVCLVVIQITVGVIMAIRTYALYGRGKRMGVFLVVTFICALAVGSWSVTGKSTSSNLDISLISGCHPALEKEEEFRLISAWGALLIYDTVVFLFTLRKAVDIWRTGPSRFFHVLLRDGSIYFFVVVMANLSNILAFLLAPPILKDVCTSYTSVLSVIMVSRLMVNIQNPRSFSTFISGEDQLTSMVINTLRFSPVTLGTESGTLSSMPDFEPGVDRSRSPTWTDTAWRMEDDAGEDTGNELREI